MRVPKSLLLTSLITALSSPAFAYQDSAPVISATPIYQSVNEPRRECWMEHTGYEPPAYRERERNYGGAILGAIVGGVVGHQFGKGGGKDAATAIGAATGAIVGDNIDNDGHRGPPAYARGRPHPEQRCRSVDNWTQRLTGYNVTYRYNGQDYTVVMPYDPGRTVRVNVNVTLAESSRW